MSRHSSNGSTDHRIRTGLFGFYVISWTVDRYVQGSRLRWPTTYRRDTDRAGAERFAKKWDVPMPENAT